MEQTLETKAGSGELFPIHERKCYKCQKTRPLSLFYIEMEQKRVRREGRSRWYAPCKICNRERNTAYRKPRQDYVEKIKKESGCADCGLMLPEHPEVFDFDHLDPSQKKDNIATLLTKGTFQDLVDEIAKCEVVCSNCHRIRTRRNPVRRAKG